MLRTFLKSKIHRATVTRTDLHYPGSITIDEALLEAADILPYEKVQVVNLNNGARLETYVMVGKKNSGVVGMNGGMARWACVGDTVLIITYAEVDEDETRSHKPKLIYVDGKNRVVKK
jgi:aspartate 1-decarboxylase